MLKVGSLTTTRIKGDNEMKNLKQIMATGIVTVFSALFLTACGGGGGTDPDPDPGVSAPTLSLGFGVKQLQFSWTAASDATHYKLMENPDGASGFTQLGADITVNSVNIDIAVHRHDWSNARYLVQACNATSCSDSNEVNTLGSVLSAIGYFKASNTETDDQFGWSVDISSDGQTLAVGAQTEASGEGAVYVFTRSSGGDWSQTAYVKASNADADDNFGYSISLSNDGTTLAVGAYREDSDASGINGGTTAVNNNDGISAGAAYVFININGSWSQQAYIKASNTKALDQFGWSVALNSDGNTLAVGAISEDSNAIGINNDQTSTSATNAGAVYVFTRSSGNWSQQAYVKASNTDTSDNFGFSIALSSDGNTLAVGAETEDSNAIGINSDQTDDSATNAGAVYVFTRSSSNWNQQAYIKASNTGEFDQFGWVVALSDDGDTLAVAANGEDGGSTGVNEPDNNDIGNSGAVYAFARTAGSWSQQAYIKAFNPGNFDFFAHSIALSGDGTTLAVGANGEDSNATAINGADNNLAGEAGAVYTFAQSAGSWTPQAYIKASNTGNNDNFGYSVALNSDGNTLAVGARTEASNAMGINGDQTDDSAADAGAVYLY